VAVIPVNVPAGAIEVDGVSFRYGRRRQLSDVSFSVDEAEVCCLLGPNGAGKTTLLRCLLGLLRPERGTIRVAGFDTRRLSARRLARLVAYVPQSTSAPFPFSALDIAVMGRTPYLAVGTTPSATDRRVAMGQLQQLGIEHLAGRAFSKLSGGERQLTLLARALVQEAPVLVFDEPTAALDYGNEVRILQVVAELGRAGRAVLMTTHQPAHALAHAGRAVLLRDGAVLANGKPRDVVTGPALSDLYETAIGVVPVVLPGRSDVALRTCIPVPPRPHG
jgi:iron complex transport system ATP-binding protein